MRGLAALTAAAAVSCATASVAPVPTEPLTLEVPGYIDFLAVDGDSVWGVNEARVERWSKQGRTASVQLNRPCGGMAVHSDFLWVADCAAGAVYKIDARAARTTAVVRTGIASPDGETNVVAGAGSVWVPSDASGGISRIDPSSGRVIAVVPVDPDTRYLAFGFGFLWAVSSSSESLQKIDPARNSVVRRLPLGGGPGFLAAGEGAVWVQLQKEGAVVRIDPVGVEATGRVEVGDTLKWGDIDTGGGRVWLRTTEDQTFVVIDPRTLAIAGRVGRASGSGAIRFAGDAVWTSQHDRDELSWWSLSLPAQSATPGR